MSIISSQRFILVFRGPIRTMISSTCASRLHHHFWPVGSAAPWWPAVNAKACGNWRLTSIGAKPLPWLDAGPAMAGDFWNRLDHPLWEGHTKPREKQLVRL